ncbi:hypothetical protein [Salipiger sp.]|uniref:hypothetical protein n=1 Tax=Salipiger sp. TaxID=2078585 RepID=UPI003A97F9B2
MSLIAYTSHTAVSLLQASTGPNGAQASVGSAVIDVSLVAGSADGGKADADPGSAGAETTAARDAGALLRAARDREEAGSAAARDVQTLSGARDRGLHRMRKRMVQLGKALQRLMGGHPGKGRGVTIYTGRGNDTLTARSDGAVGAIHTGRGNDAVSITAGAVYGLRTGAGSDAVTLSAEVVRGVHTDPRHRGAGGGDDAVAIRAALAQGIYTGRGADAIAIDADAVVGVHSGAGSDAVTLDAGLVGDIRTGSGNDAVTVRAVVGASQVGTLVGDDPYTPGDTAEARMLSAVAGGADVDTGSGDDAITLDVLTVLSLEAGRGDDAILLEGGTVALRYDAGDGNDTVMLSDGAEVVIRLGEDVGDWSLTEEGNALILHLGEGSIRFEGATDAAAIGLVRAGEEGVTMLRATPALDAYA